MTPLLSHCSLLTVVDFFAAEADSLLELQHSSSKEPKSAKDETEASQKSVKKTVLSLDKKSALKVQ